MEGFDEESIDMSSFMSGGDSILSSLADDRISLLRNASGGSRARRFVDLGCGLDHSDGRHTHERFFSPSLCHRAHEAGWAVTGLDFGELRRPVPWRFISGNINTVTPEDIGGPFHWVNSIKLYSVRHPQFISPGLVLPSGFLPYTSFRTFEDLLHDEYLACIRRFFELVKGVLCEGGVFTLNDRDIYVKRNNVLDHIKAAPGRFLDVNNGYIVQ